MGDERAARREELAALRAGLDLGLQLIDTAEMYGDGRAEELVAEAIAGRREQAYLVSKVLPRNASRRGTIEACKRSLKRLETDYLDLYLLHWRESRPLAETLEAFVTLRDEGLIRHFGVSNFDRDDMEEARALPGGEGIAANQILYNLQRRGSEWDLQPWCAEHGVSIMAYTPLGNSGRDQRAILGDATVKSNCGAPRRDAGASRARVAAATRQHRDDTESGHRKACSRESRRAGSEAIRRPT